MELSPKAHEILDVAEDMARRGGYGGFSFRDIADAVGIKSASVHYHFKTKPDLGVALVERYTDRFIDGLGDPADPDTPAEHKVKAYIAAFRTALHDEGLMCLCGIFGAESAGLPEAVAKKSREFFTRNCAWLETALEGHDAHTSEAARRQAALLLIARLEGAMLMARSLGDLSVFDTIAEAD